MRSRRWWLFFELLLAVVLVVGEGRRTIRPHDGEPPRVVENAKTHFKVPVSSKQFKFVCPVAEESDSDTLLFQWSKDGEHVEIEWDDRLKVGKNGRELRIKPLKEEDSGHYECQVTNGFGHRVVKFTLHVYDESSATSQASRGSILLTNQSMAPRWLNEQDMTASANVRIARGGRLELRCPAKGRPLPEIQWFHNDASLDAIFTKDNVGDLDEGVYRCVLRNDLGSIEADFHVTVSNELESPVEDMLTKEPTSGLVIDPINSTVHRGRTAQFQCHAHTLQPAVIKWLKKIDDLAQFKAENPNATIINANQMNLLVIDTNNMDPHAGGEHTNRLIFARVQPEHAGEYLCVVTNKLGNFVYGSAYLTVIDTYQFGLPGLPVIVIVIVFCFIILLVICAIHFLLKYQKADAQASKAMHTNQWQQPPPPRMPPPPAPEMHRPLVGDDCCNSPQPYVHRGKALFENGKYSCACHSPHSPHLSFPTSGYGSQRGYYRTLEMLRQPAPSLQSSDY